MVPRVFRGRDEAVAAIETALKGGGGRVAISALHGLRGVGKSVLAAAYAELHSGEYRATWWIRSETEAALGLDHPTVANRLNNLAGLLRATGRAGEAEPLFRRALAIDETALGPDHPAVANRLNLGLLLGDTGRAGEAEPLLRRALAIFEASLGPEHPHTVTARENLAALLAGR